MDGAVISENLVISDSRSGQTISEEAIREALARILESAIFTNRTSLAGFFASQSERL